MDVAPLRHLGRGRLVAIGLNSVIGGGIFILPATVAALTGSASLFGYLAAACVVAGVGTALGVLAGGASSSGGPYLYTRRAFGPFAGFVVGWLFCLARLSAMANLMVGFAQYLGTLLPGADAPLPRAAFILLCAAGVVGTNIAGIRSTSGASSLLAIVKVAPLLLLGLAGLFFLRPGAFAMQPPEPAAFLRTVLLLIYAFTGFEILTVPAEESLDPRRDMPRALYATIAIVSGLYLLVHAASIGLLPGLASEPAPLATAAGLLAGPAGRYGMTAVAAASMFGCTLVSLVGASRLLYAMARAGQIPAWLGALSPVTRAPATACLLTGAVASLLALTGTYATLAAFSAGARLLVYLACCLACLRPAAAGGAAARGEASGWPPRWSRWVALATAAAIIGLLAGLERREILYGVGGAAFGALLYGGARAGRPGVTSNELTRLR
jgi:amino acid transporter